MLSTSKSSPAHCPTSTVIVAHQLHVSRFNIGRRYRRGVSVPKFHVIVPI